MFQIKTETHQQSMKYENMNPGMKKQPCNFPLNTIMTYQFLMMVETGRYTKSSWIKAPSKSVHLNSLKIYLKCIFSALNSILVNVCSLSK